MARHGSSRHEASQPPFIVKGCLFDAEKESEIKLTTKL